MELQTQSLTLGFRTNMPAFGAHSDSTWSSPEIQLEFAWVLINDRVRDGMQKNLTMHFSLEKTNIFATTYSESITNV